MTKKQIETIIQENMQKIYLYCVKRLENTVAAQDVASDIILEMLRSYRRIQSDEAVYGYMWRVANNLCKNYWRKVQKKGIRKFLMILKAPAVFLLRKIC